MKTVHLFSFTQRSETGLEGRSFIFEFEEKGQEFRFLLESKLPNPQLFETKIDGEHLEFKNRIENLNAMDIEQGFDRYCSWPEDAESVTITITRGNAHVTQTCPKDACSLDVPLYLFFYVDDRDRPTFTVDLEFNYKPATP